MENKNSNIYAKPFLKWAGGKSQLIKEIECFYPFKDGNITKYAEPFLGGGAVLFDVLNKFELDEIYVSDTNGDLINAYCTVRDDVEYLINALTEMQKQFVPLNTELRKNYYIEKRERFNLLKKYGDFDSGVERAALMIFLNKTCFNGLYRVNKNGFFNVPMGSYKNPIICDEKNLRNVAQKLKNVTIVMGDYKKSERFIDENTFAYFDPPYRPITDTSSFTSYTENLFDDGKQEELAHFVDNLSRKGAKILVSNSDPKNTNQNDDFFEQIYISHNIKRVGANRMINCNGQSRGKIKELLISNF